MKDWWGRSAERGYTYSPSVFRLGWDKGRKSGFSDWLDVGEDTVKVFKNAYQYAKNVCSVLEVPPKVNINLKTETSNQTNIFLGTSMFDRTDLTSAEKLDIFLGQTVVKASTNLHVDDYIAFEDPLTRIIEKERCLRKVLTTSPGFDTIVGEYKKYIFSNRSDKSSPVPEGVRVLKTILNLISFPPNADAELIEKYPSLFNEVQEVLSTFGDSTKDSCEQARDIKNIIRKYLALESPENLSSKGSGNSKSKENNSEQDSKDSANDSKGQGEQSSDSNSESKMSSKGNKDSDNSSDSTDSNSKSYPSGDSSIDPSELMSGKDTLRTLDRLIAASEKQDEKNSSRSKDMNDKTEQIVKDTYKKVDKDVDCLKMKDHKSNYLIHYDSIKGQINPLVNAFNKFIVHTQTKITGMRRGKLDTNKLAEAYQNVETVFSNIIKKDSSGLDVCVLVDESGSMYGRKIHAAKSAAILLNEVFKKIPMCNFYIYGHSADEHDCETVIRVYKDNWNKNKFSLGSIDAHCNNRDHTAIEQVHKLVRTQTNRPLLMFVLSDGYPAAHGYSSLNDGIKKVKQTVQEIERKNNTIICQISIEASVDWTKMFNYGIQLTDINNLAPDLSRYIINTLISKIKVVES